MKLLERFKAWRWQRAREREYGRRCREIVKRRVYAMTYDEREAFFAQSYDDSWRRLFADARAELAAQGVYEP